MEVFCILLSKLVISPSLLKIFVNGLAICIRQRNLYAQAYAEPVLVTNHVVSGESSNADSA